MKLCGGGCGSKISDDARRCDACNAEKSGNPGEDGIKVHSPFANDSIRSHTFTDRVRFHFLYGDRRWWERLQPLMLRRQPFCAMCQAHISEIVDHIVPAGIAIQQAQESGRWTLDKYAGFYLQTNLQGLCRSCHGKKTEQDKAHAGPWPSVVEAFDKAPQRKWSF